MPRMDMFWIDAFADAPFKGNPAVVCLLDAWLPDALHQEIAREFNVSETVFIAPVGDEYGIRWFTPTVEVDLVGHATLAAAFAVMRYVEPDRSSVLFRSPKSGPLAAHRDGDSISIELPADETKPCAPPHELIAGLGLKPVETRRGRHYLAVLGSKEQVRLLEPNFVELAKLDLPTITVTARGAASDYVLRFFAPANGVPEDPVSGVAQCSLMPYWSMRIGRTALSSEQLSSRGGLMRCKLEGDRVVISGPCASVARGELQIDLTSSAHGKIVS